MRKYLNPDKSYHLEQGDYIQVEDGRWLVKLPGGPHPGATAYLNPTHTITIHEDGEITVEPSILLKFGDSQTWHGYLRHGLFTQTP